MRRLALWLTCFIWAARFEIPQGRMEIYHSFKQFSVQYAACRLDIPFTVHPGIGYDIIYTHPLNCGGAVGRASVDFLTYAQSISQLSGGVHIAIGSAVMAPMVFEKSLSMANNLALQRDGRPLSDYSLGVVDIQDGGDWDWSLGEPPADNPAYYLRFCKSFYRMGRDTRLHLPGQSRLHAWDYVGAEQTGGSTWNRQRLEELLSKFPTRRIAVMGDYFLDRYLDFDSELAEISLETGKTANQVVSVRHSPGAAGTVVCNLHALGCRCITCIGFRGDDGEGYELLQDLTRWPA